MQGDELIERLTKTTEDLFVDEKIKIGDSAILSSARQNSALKRAAELLNIAIKSLESGFSQDAVAGDIERTLAAVSELDGKAVNEEVVAEIFSKFCVGK